MIRNRPLLVLGFMLSVGCDGTNPTPAGRGLELQVSPLELATPSDVCYRFEVRNESGNTVWSESGICSSQYGSSKGDITYIGTCDAGDDKDAVAGSQNTVTLTIEQILDGGVPIPDDEWENPCSRDASGALVGAYSDNYPACQRTVTCQENADVPVVFDLTVMFRAHQGFFDIAVNFEDIFCSAKADSCYNADNAGGGQPIELLFGTNAEGAVVRQRTAVFGLACTAGPGSTQDTDLLLGQVTITCDSGPGTPVVTTYDVNLNGQSRGNHKLDDNSASTAYDGLPVAYYFGAEALNCSGAPCNKLYYNIAVNTQFLADRNLRCSMGYRATAVDNATSPFVAGILTAIGSHYGAILYDAVPLTVKTGSTIVPSCESHPLFAEGSRVKVDYLQNNGSLSQQSFNYVFGGANDGATTSGSFLVSPTGMRSSNAGGVTIFSNNDWGTAPNMLDRWRAFDGITTGDSYQPISHWGGFPTTWPAILGYITPFANRARWYSMTSRASSNGYVYPPTDWTLQGSNDTTTGLDGTWTALDSRSGQTFTSGHTLSYAIASPGRYRSYRILITGANTPNVVLLDELRLFDGLEVISPVGMTANSNEAGDRAFSSSESEFPYAEHLSYATFCAFDDKIASWLSFWQSSATTPFYVGYERTVPRVMKAYEVMASAGFDYGPLNWTLEGTNAALDANGNITGTGTWTVLDSQNNVAWTVNGGGEIKMFDVPSNTTAYRAYRIRFNTAAATSRGQILELRLFGWASD